MKVLGVVRAVLALRRRKMLMLGVGVAVGFAAGWWIFGRGGTSQEWRDWRDQRDRAFANLEVQRDTAEVLRARVEVQTAAMIEHGSRADSLRAAVEALQRRVQPVRLPTDPDAPPGTAVEQPDAVPATLEAFAEQVVLRDSIIAVQTAEIVELRAEGSSADSVIATLHRAVRERDGTIATLTALVEAVPDPPAWWIPEIGVSFGVGAVRPLGGNIRPGAAFVATVGWRVEWQDLRRLF